MNTHRRAVLSVGAGIVTAGCFGSREQPRLRLYNNHDEPHYLHVRVTGTENDEPALTHTAYLSPDEDDIAPDRIDWDAIGGEFQVVTKIDHDDEQVHDLSGGFDSLSVAIDSDRMISFDKAVR